MTRGAYSKSTDRPTRPKTSVLDSLAYFSNVEKVCSDQGASPLFSAFRRKVEFICVSSTYAVVYQAESSQLTKSETPNAESFDFS